MAETLEEEFYSDKFKNIRAKLYKDAYDQGRFDEYADITYGYGKYEKNVKPLNNGIEVKCNVEYAGKLPKRERIE